MTVSPRSQHLLDQYLAHATEIWGRLEGVRERLVDEGYSRDEAWCIIERIESRIMGPITDYAAHGAMAADEIRAVIEDELHDSGERGS